MGHPSKSYSPEPIFDLHLETFCITMKARACVLLLWVFSKLKLKLALCRICIYHMELPCIRPAADLAECLRALAQTEQLVTQKQTENCLVIYIKIYLKGSKNT